MSFPLATSLPTPDTTPSTTDDDLLDQDLIDSHNTRPCKRKRTHAHAVQKEHALSSHINAPQRAASPSPLDPNSLPTLTSALHVLRTEAAALSHVSGLYATDLTARSALVRCVDVICDANARGGKTLICGVGKSGYVGMKMTATMKSLGLRCTFLHAAEAMHGDLGDVGENDVVLFVTFSGKTPELTTLAAHLPLSVPLLAITSHKDALSCPLFASHHMRQRQQHGSTTSTQAPAPTIILPAPIPESEESTFGVSAPTTSTTVAIAVGDMLALTVAGKVHGEKAGAVFRRNHPGGNIGALTRLGL